MTEAGSAMRTGPEEKESGSEKVTFVDAADVGVGDMGRLYEQCLSHDALGAREELKRMDIDDWGALVKGKVLAGVGETILKAVRSPLYGLVGFVRITVKGEPASHGREAVIEDLAILPTAPDGTLSALLEEALESVKDKGVSDIQVKVHERNEKLIGKLRNELKFAESGREAAPAKDGEDAGNILVMTRSFA